MYKYVCTYIKICSLNVRSVNNKSLCIHDYIVENDLDALFICETWLGSDLDNISISQLLPPTYKILHQPRMVRKGGGVAIVFRECLQLVKSDCSDPSANLEYITCQASINKHKYTTMPAKSYRTPYNKHSTTHIFPYRLSASIYTRQVLFTVYVWSMVGHWCHKSLFYA